MANRYQTALLGELTGDDPLGLPKPKSGNTGVTGLAGQSQLHPVPLDNGLPNGGMEKMPQIIEPDQPPPSLSLTPGGPAAPPALGAFGNKLEGFDAGKLSSGHNTPKYQLGRTFSHFDPKGGNTQELFDKLNALGIGTFSGELGSDKIRIGGNADPEFKGVSEIDWIRDLDNGGGIQYDPTMVNGAPVDSGAPMGGGGGPQGFLNPMLMGDPSAAIAQGAGSFGEQSALLKALLAEMGVRS